MPAVRTLELKIPPPLVALLLAAAMWAADRTAWGGPRLPLADPARLALVGVLVVAALLAELSGLVAFRASRTTINPLAPQRTRALVTGGIYRVTRNPMYVGLAGQLLAWATWLGSLLPFAGPVLFVLYITRFQILPEERVLAGLFGQAWHDYSSRVRRWL